MRYKHFLLAILTAALAFSTAALAGVPGAVVTNTAQPENKNNYYYEKLTLENLSKTYWALSKFELTDDKAVDFYAMINECDIYKQFSGNEFEWSSIREATRNHIKDNKRDFPLRYEMIQMIKFGEYDKENQAFEILNDYKIDGARRFEVGAENFADSVCGYDTSGFGKNVPGYPRGLIIILTRPVGLIKVPMKEDIARQYLEEKTLGKRLVVNAEKQIDQIYDLRTAYMVMKVKLFAYEKEVIPRGSVTKLAEVLAILEKIEIYSDVNEKNLLYSEDYTRKKQNTKKLNVLANLRAKTDKRTGLLAPDVPSLLPVEDIVPPQQEKTAQ